MKPAPFSYKAPRSLDEALGQLAESGADGKLLAGGQSLVPAMNFRVVRPEVLIDLNRIPELNYIRPQDGGSVRIGAMTRERQLELDPRLAASQPLLAEAMPHIAHPQIRNRGTLGGSLSNADPAAELPVVMLALEARFLVRKTGHERWVPARDFFSGMFTTDMAADEMLAEIELPAMPKRTGWAFFEVAPRAGDYALMGVAVTLSLDEGGRCHTAKLVYLNAGDGPVDATEAAQMLEGAELTDASFDGAAAHASEKEINPYGNLHATPEFQRHLARVLTRRALAQAAQRARGAHLQ
jgi:CO/xanthine dehydrogenase FAD-binding subunit